MNNDPLFIMLADDDEADRLLFKEVFSELKIRTTVVTVNNGDELMKWLSENPSPLPKLLFLDLNMPRKNGLECLKEIRSSETLKNISIAIYSTSNSKKDMEETFNLGANIYITKPADFKDLKQVLEKAVMTTFSYKDKSMKWENFILKL